MQITITQAAEQAILEQAKSKGKDSCLRIGVRGGGCTGFSYIIEWADGPPKQTDVIFSAGETRVFIDPKSLVYLAGSELDYIKTLMGQGFQINNPQAKGTCGCGASVQF